MTLLSYSQQPLHPQQPWDGSAMPSQAGKIAIVTGANSGIGFYTARALAERGAHVVMACRNEKRGREAELELTKYLLNQEHTPTKIGSVEFMPLELASLASVRAFVAAFQQRGFTKLDLLINNAGLACPAEQTTRDGLETQFQVNHLSHFLLTALLFPWLKNAPSARIVNVSSHAHRIVMNMEYETLAQGTDQSFVRYGRSKLANLMFTNELAARLAKAQISSIKAVAAHPGTTYSDMGDKFVEGVCPQAQWSVWKWLLTVIPTQATDMGALPTLYAATVDDVASGDYYGPGDCMNLKGLPAKEIPMTMASSRQDCLTLWELSERLTGTTFQVVQHP